MKVKTMKDCKLPNPNIVVMPYNVSWTKNFWNFIKIEEVRNMSKVLGVIKGLHKELQAQ